MSSVATIAGRFDAALRRHGVAAGTRRALTFAEVLRVLAPPSLHDLYWHARVAMLPSIDDAERFDAAFAETFGVRRAEAEALPTPAAPPRDPRAPERAALPPPPSERVAGPGDAARAPVRWIAASPDERLRERDFDEIAVHERAAMLRLIARLRVGGDWRRSRRRRPHAHGDRFDFRATLRGAARTQGELIPPRASTRRRRLRPLVFLLDVSGSMEPFARALLQYARVTAIARPRVRVFAFATRLTDLGPLLRRPSDAGLMTALARTIADFGGGTRIGAALRTFNDRYAQRGAARGGTVVILSDGWERDDPALLDAQMARLRLLARRIVWVNPHKRHPAYEPLARGMAAALRHLDAFVSGHNVRSLEAVADAIEGNAA